MWIARDKNGLFYIYEAYPIRDYVSFEWYTLKGKYFCPCSDYSYILPKKISYNIDMLTWESGPMWCRLVNVNHKE